MSDGIYTHYDELLSERGQIEDEIVKRGRFTQQEIDEIGLLEVVKQILQLLSYSEENTRYWEEKNYAQDN